MGMREASHRYPGGNRMQRRMARRKARIKKVVTLAALISSASLMMAMGISSEPEKLDIIETTEPLVTIIPTEETTGDLLEVLKETQAQMVEELVVETTAPQLPWTEREVEIIAKTVYGEALITHSDTEMSAVVWCILNRVDSQLYPDSITEVVVKSQFHGYDESNPVDQHIKGLVEDVLRRWYTGSEGRTLPERFLYFWGDGRHNHFTTEFLGGETWDWSMPTPYES